ncbi:hypothetical protein IG195_21760 (plasmid) [Arthrobacter sp. TES]|nr:hypothetical protein IG195_21760 [Arthrobacter sp. TES]
MGVEALDPHGRERTEDNRGVWRVEEAKVQEFIDEAYRKTAEAIAKGEVDDEPAED